MKIKKVFMEDTSVFSAMKSPANTTDSQFWPQNKKQINKFIKNTNFKENVKNGCREWLENSSVHGVPKILKSSQLPIRILWLFSVLISLCGLVFVISQIFIDYYNFGVNTNIQIIREMPTDFPAVTICNYNAYSTDQGLEYLYSLAEDFNFTVQTLKQYKATRNRAYINKIVTVIQAQMSLDSNMEARKNYSLKMEQMLISCFFQKLECNHSEFEYYWHPKFGNCYRFNSGMNDLNSSIPIRKSYNQGYLTGFKIELNVGSQFPDNFLVEGAGVYIAVHNQSLIPIIPDEGVFLPAGKSNYVAIRRKFYKSLDKPYSSCLKDTRSENAFDSDLYRLAFTITKQYSQKYCYKFCYQKYIIKKCNCYDTNYKKYNIGNKDPCLNRTDILCQLDAEIDFNTNDYATKNCQPSCPFECERIDYELSVFGTDYPTNGYLAISQDTEKNAADATKRSLLEVNVYYDSSEYQFIYEVPSFGLLQLFSNMGGYLGLFMGISILSILELFELILIIGHKFFV